MLLKLTKKQLDDISDLTLTSLRRSLDFIFTHQLQEYIKAMQYVMYLTGYFIFQSDNIQQDKLIQWVKQTKFDNLSNGERRLIYSKLIMGNFN